MSHREKDHGLGWAGLELAKGAQAGSGLGEGFLVGPAEGRAGFEF